MKGSKDRRIGYLGNGRYRMTQKGWDDAMTAGIPFELLDVEIEDLGNGESEWRYLHPVNGAEVISVRCSHRGKMEDIEEFG
jgi:hypothetical protein